MLYINQPLIGYIQICHFISRFAHSQICNNNEKMIRSTLNEQIEAEPLQYMRNYEIVSIRRANREQHFKNKRVSPSLDQREITTIPIDPVLRAQEVYNQRFQESDFLQLLQNIQSDDDPHQLLRSAVGLRRLVALNCHLGKRILQEGHVNRLLKLAQVDQHPQIMAEALWCLDNILGGEQIDENVLIESEIAEVFVRILQHSHQFDSIIYQHVTIGLGNLAAESQQIRDYLLDMDCITHMVKTLCTSEELQVKVLTNTCWALSNMVRSFTIPPYSKVEAAVKYICCVLVQGIQNLQTPALMSDCLFVLSHHVNPKNGNLQEMKNLGLIPCIIKLCRESSSKSLIVPCLRVLGNYSSGQNKYIELMIRCGLIQLLNTTLESEYAIVRRETCWMLSNIAATPIQIASHIFNNRKLLNKLIELFSIDETSNRKEICFIFCNLSYSMMVDQYFRLIVAVDLAQNITSLLQFEDSRMLVAVLKCLVMVLHYLQKESQACLLAFLNHFERAGGYQQLVRLQSSDNQQVYDLVSQLIKNYYQDYADFEETEKYELYNRQAENQQNQSDDDYDFDEGFQQFKSNNPL